MKPVTYIAVLAWKVTKSMKISVKDHHVRQLYIILPNANIYSEQTKLIESFLLLISPGCQYQCHKYASCIQLDRNNNVCRCLGGYQGNGVTQCERVVEPGCTENSCPANAECKNTGSAFKCSCARVIKLIGYKVLAIIIYDIFLI